MRPRIGLSVMPLETRRKAIVGLATEGNRLGYDGFFLPETWAYDITVLLAEAAARTTRITLGTAMNADPLRDITEEDVRRYDEERLP